MPQNRVDRSIFGSDLIHNINTLVGMAETMTDLHRLLKSNKDLIFKNIKFSDYKSISDDLKKGLSENNGRKLDIDVIKVLARKKLSYSITSRSGEIVHQASNVPIRSIKDIANELQSSLDALFPNMNEVLILNNRGISYISIVDVIPINLSNLVSIDVIFKTHTETYDFGKSTSVLEWLKYFFPNYEELQNSLAEMKQLALDASNSANESKNYSEDSEASAIRAETSETNSKDSETKSKTSENNAKTSADNAKTSETNAKNSENKANTSASNAKTSEENANKSAKEAKDVVDDLNNSNEIVIGIIEEAREIETRVKFSEDKAKKWADNAVDTPVETGKYSAKHWAEKAKEGIVSIENSQEVIGKKITPKKSPSTLDYKGFQESDRYGTDSIDINYATGLGMYTRTEDTITSPPITSLTRFNFWNIYAQPYLKIPVEVIGGRPTLPLLNIDNVGYNNMFLPSNFTITGCYGRAGTKFKYTGDTLISGVLQGRVSVSIRLNKNTGRDVPIEKLITPNTWLTMVGTPKPEYENRDTVGLSMYGVTNNDRKPYLKSRRGRDETLNTILSYSEVLPYVETKPPIEITYEDGRILAGSTSEEIDKYNLNNRTTGWIDVYSCTDFILKTDGASTASRVQWKDAYGNIHYDAAISTNPLDSNRIISLNANAKQFRVWFKAASDTEITKLDVWEVPLEINQNYGYWYDLEFNVCETVVFYPNSEYFFQLRIYNGELISAMDNYGMFINSGGLTLITENKDTTQKFYEGWKSND